MLFIAVQVFAGQRSDPNRDRPLVGLPVLIKPLSLPSPVERKAKESVRNNGGILRELNHCVGHVQNYFQMEGNLTENSSVLR